jgi:proteasome lid subunit RPN8/RPN11
MISLSGKLDRRMREQAEKAYPYEGCGFLLGDLDVEGRRVVEIVPAVNRRADSPRNRYLISPDQYREVERDAGARGLVVLGFFHSHPDAPARPSEYDREHAWPWYSYLIVSVVRGRATEATCWRLSDDRGELIEEEIEIPGSAESVPRSA